MSLTQIHLSQILSPGSFEELLRSSHDAKLWLQAFRKGDPGRRKALRCLVQQQTFAVCKKGFVPVGHGKKEQLDLDDQRRAVCSVKWYSNEHPYKPLGSPLYSDTRIWVVEGDCLEAGLALRRARFYPVVLVMASHRRPGGGYKNGTPRFHLHTCNRV